MEGLCTWMLLLAAAKREPNQGTFTFTSEPEAWTKLGATANGFTFNEFITWCGRAKKTRRTVSGRVSYVEIIGWQQWNDAWEREADNRRKSRKRAQITPDISRNLSGTSPEVAGTEVEVEYEVEVKPLASPVVTPKKERRRDLAWETLLDVCGIDQASLTRSGRGPANRALADIRAAGGAEPDQIRGRAAEFRRRYPEISLTPMALAKHWGALRPVESVRADKYAHLKEAS